MAASSSSPSPKMFKLVSKDWKEFIVEESVAKVSGFIKESIEHGSTIITLDKTKAEVLEKVIKYCEKHAQDEYRKNWIPNLANLNLETLIGLFQAAHYLCVKGLMDSIYKQVKDITGGNIPEEIRMIHFVPEENPE
ncbi:hypothetical protein AAC387_Pa01g1151 [Persea americana]